MIHEPISKESALAIARAMKFPIPAFVLAQRDLAKAAFDADHADFFIHSRNLQGAIDDLAESLLKDAPLAIREDFQASQRFTVAIGEIVCEAT